MKQAITNRIIIGGSGSTGSSLLKNVLNRHPSIYAGVETSLFCKRELFQNWTGYKKRILRNGAFGLRNFGWHIYNGTDLINNEYGYTREEVSRLIATSNQFQEFADTYFGTRMEREEKQMWCEKTPANAFLFHEFLSQFERAKCIHMVRNPYDTVASLVSRGFNVYYAVGIYLLNTSAALKQRFSSNYHEVKYELLTTKPEETLNHLYGFLNVVYRDDRIEDARPEIQTTQLKGWNYDETEAIGKKSIGRFELLDEEEKSYILNAIDRITVSKKGMTFFNLDVSTIKEICQILDYEYKMPLATKKQDLNSSQWKDALSRTVRGYATGITNCPLQIKGK